MQLARIPGDEIVINIKIGMVIEANINMLRFHI